jgi:DNA-binding YbaB/EbfC family protein
MFGDMLGKLTGLKAKMDEAAKAAGNRTIKATVGGGLVSATANGRQEIVKIELDPVTLTDKAMLEDLIVAACNQAIAQTRTFTQEEMQKVVAELGVALPPGFDLSKMF